MSLHCILTWGKGRDLSQFSFMRTLISFKLKNWCLLLNCDVGEDSWEFLGLQGDQTSPSSRRSVLNIHWKDWRWSWNSNTLATWCKELTHWKRPWCWERLKAGGEGDYREWDCWMASLTQRTWVWASSKRWWRTWLSDWNESHSKPKALHLWPNHLPKAPPPNTIT